MTPTELQSLTENLRTLPSETEWVEFKHNIVDPHEIGGYISALSNGAALHRRPQAFLLWGIDNSSHKLTGTSFHPRQTKVGSVTSRVIRDTITAELVRQGGGSTKGASYAPFWA